MAERIFIKDMSQVIAAGANFDFIDEYVPANSRLIILEFGNDLSNVLGWTLVHWQFLKNGLGHYPMDDVFDQMGYAAQRQAVQQLEWMGGDRFQLRGVADAGTPAGTAVLISIKYKIVDND